MSFWAERLKEAKYSLEEEALRPYFALPNVLQASDCPRVACSMAERLLNFGMRFRGSRYAGQSFLPSCAAGKNPRRLSAHSPRMSRCCRACLR